MMKSILFELLRIQTEIYKKYKRKVPYIKVHNFIKAYATLDGLEPVGLTFYFQSELK